MILFDLICSEGHGFEAWFRDSGSFERLAAVGEIQCAVCGGTQVRKALMAPNISTSKARAGGKARVEEGAEEASPAPHAPAEAEVGARGRPGSMTVHQGHPGPLSGPQGLPVPEKIAEAMQILRKVQTHIEKSFDHVGDRFAEEARKMHYGETEKRSIYGQATEDEAQELADEGIDVNRMPWLTPRNS
ncbi:MAG: DUF1178 family protein [Alphaproteobacteria bacterium]